MPIWEPAGEPPSKLGYYRVLSSRAGVRVSPLALGAMSIGDKWAGSMGSMDKESSFKLLDAYFDLGGNFIDTSNNYQDETSEQFIGEWAETRDIRDQLFIATKYSTGYKTHDTSIQQKVNFVGNNTKSLMVSVERSLKKLRTSYIDLLYVHWWDWDTSVEEVMDSLHNLVASGKVLYLGISDSPAWVVTWANAYAKAHGKTPFVVYQGQWSILDRSFERDIIPMARAAGLALAPWGVLAAGKLRSDEEEQKRKESGENGRQMFSAQWERTEQEVQVSRALEKVAKEVGVKSLTAVAIAYVLQKTPYVFPIIGGRKIEQLEANIEALDISLSAEQIAFLEEASPIDLGFPLNVIGDGAQGSAWVGFSAKTSRLPLQQAIKP